MLINWWTEISHLVHHFQNLIRLQIVILLSACNSLSVPISKVLHHLHGLLSFLREQNLCLSDKSNQSSTPIMIHFHVCLINSVPKFVNDLRHGCDFRIEHLSQKQIRSIRFESGQFVHLIILCKDCFRDMS
jgi:hypothetical protein